MHLAKFSKILFYTLVMQPYSIHFAKIVSISYFEQFYYASGEGMRFIYTTVSNLWRTLTTLNTFFSENLKE